jgi:hypothetical protein
MILVVAARDARGGLATLRLAGGLGVVAGEGDAGAVVVKLRAVDVEAADGLHHETGLELGPFGVEEPLQGPAHPIIVEQFAAAGRGEPQEAVVTVSRPLAESVERQPSLDDAAQHPRRAPPTWPAGSADRP